MFEVDIAVDNELGRHAIEKMDEYLEKSAKDNYHQAKDWPIARSQISGLCQIATNQPNNIDEFAQHQRSKVAKKLEDKQKEEMRNELKAKEEFWNLVCSLCSGKSSKVDWSLAWERDQHLPDELRDENLPSGAKLTKEQQAAQKEKRERRESWQKQWNSAHYPPFFQRFCAHYLYQMSQRTQES